MKARLAIGLGVVGALLGCGQVESARDAGVDAAGSAPVYCYQIGGPSTSPPGSPDAGLGPEDCDGGICVKAAVDAYWHCASKK